MLYIVGSGPGDPELLTIKAHNTIKTADVILYDHLANENILILAPKHCIRVYVGKTPYQNYIQQEEIHALISWYCQRFERVVRLKGGDPYIFGRGFEEMGYARQQGIPASYIPGISSMQGAGCCDVPLTHRGVSDSIWVLTGTKADGDFSADLQLAIRSRATVVIYMGMRKLEEIAHIYVMNGKGRTPAAIIRHATLPHQQHIRCRAAELATMVRLHQLSHPAIVIIGDVAGLSPGGPGAL